MGIPAFSAVLLAGGESRRMGRDKAGVLVAGQALWERQLATLAALRPREILISGKRDGPYAGAGFEVLEDLHPGCGPLAGLEAASRRMETDWLCVLAIDLPWMSATFLARLLEIAGRTGRGVVPQDGGRFEPLAAVYPSAMQPVIEEQLATTDWSMQRLVRRGLELGLVVPYALADEERALFRNVNTPADL